MLILVCNLTLVLTRYVLGPILIPFERGFSMLSDDVQQPIFQSPLNFWHIFNCLFKECAIDHVS